MLNVGYNDIKSVECASIVTLIEKEAYNEESKTNYQTIDFQFMANANDNKGFNQTIKNI